MIRAVLFDRDNTLVETDPQTYEDMSHWISQRFEISVQEISYKLKTFVHESDLRWEYIRTEDDEWFFWEEYTAALLQYLGLGEHCIPATINEIITEYPYWRFFRPIRGARSLLLELQRRGLTTGILSNTFPSIRDSLQSTNLLDALDVTLATCNLGIHKPDPRAFEWALETLALPPQDVLFVDDLPENVTAARRLGMPAVLIDHTGQQPDALHSLELLLESEYFV